jgi:ABC-type bacteriocin/lantibiotic exporter with double-glycine peptidase domain
MTALYLMAASVALIAGLVWSAVRRSKRQGAAEANAEAEKRQMEAIKQSETIKDATLARMADADAASVSQPADRIRERMRKRPANTR